MLIPLSVILSLIFVISDRCAAYLILPDKIGSETGETERGRYIFDLVDENGVPTKNGSGVLIVSLAGHEAPPGTVCDDGFGHETATVICREMGYQCSEFWGSGATSEYLSSLEIVLDNVHCTKASMPFSNCSYSTEHNCGHGEDIVLRCDRLCEFSFELVDSKGKPSTNNSGLLIATKEGTGKNGTVCDDNFDGEVALVICRSMNYTCAASWGERKEWPLQATMDIILDDIACSDVDAPFNKCSWRIVHNCAHNEDVFLTCGCITDTYHFYLVDKSGEKSVNGTGLLIAEQKSPAEGATNTTGTICDDSFADTAADIICKLMDYTCSIFWETSGESRPAWQKVQKKYPVVLDNVECREGTSEDEQVHCSYSRQSNCQHSEDVFLFCGLSEQCAQSAFAFYTVDKNNEKTTNGSGLLIASRSIFGGVAGTVCDDNFNSKAATLICREMGYKCSVGWKAGTVWHEVQALYDIKLDNVACGPGNRTFQDCHYETQHNCGHSEDVFLSCADDCTYTFKLVNEIGTETDQGFGLLIASRDLTGESGTVCDDSFSDVSATVICRHMDYNCSVYWSSGEERAIQNTMDIILDNVKCTDETLNFLNCSFSSGGHNCAHREDVHLYCSDTCGKETVTFRMLDNSGVNVTSSGRGLLIASRNIADTHQIEGTVCDDEFTLIEGRVVCREMGFECAHSYNSGEIWSEVQNRFAIVLDNVDCPEGENATFAENCTYDSTHNCGHSEDVFLICGDECSGSAPVRFSLVTSTGVESTTGTGLLIATTVTTTGTVCDDQFTDEAAAAVCKELGYTCAASWDFGEEWAIQNSYQIALDNVYCETDNFTECTFDTSHNCGHSEDIFLSCADRCLSGGPIVAKLVDMAGEQSLTGEGLLIVTSTYDDISGTICNNGFSMGDGSVFCKSMGYSCATQVSSAGLDGSDPWPIQGTYDIMMTDIQCEQGARNISGCRYDLNHDCEHLNDVYLSCGGQENIARIGTATQVDSFKDRDAAWNAIDGNTIGDYFREPPSITHTRSQGHDAWWRLTWDREYAIDKIVLYNRGDCCQDRIIGVTININGQVVRTVGSENLESERYSYTGLDVTTNQIEIRGNTSYLSLAEVEVYGPDSDQRRQCSLLFALVNEEGEITSSGFGLLLANKDGYNNDAAGTVCDDYFSDQSANVICKTMGFQCSSYWTHGERWEIQNDYQILLDDVQCTSSNASFSNCTYSTRDHNCGHAEDIFLTCDNGVINLGCWTDTGERAIASLEGSHPNSTEHWSVRQDPIGVCKATVIERGWTVFAIQAGGWCSSSATAETTYHIYGSSDDCQDDGQGGEWANQVYRITEEGLENLGCWKDTASRAIPTLEHEGQHPYLDGEPYYRYNPIEKCRKAAKDSGFTVFALQAGGYCMSSATANETYDNYGAATNCDSDGEGGLWANQVYQIRDETCVFKSRDYKFYFVNEKGNMAESSGLLIAEGKAGTGEMPGTVCDDMFNETAATVICKEMGFQCSTGWTRKYWDETQKQYPIVLDDVECGSVNMSFSECGFKTTSNCGHSEDVFLGCDQECIPAKYLFELVNPDTGDPAESGKGLLVAAKNGTDTRGTVCDDGFDNLAGDIICKEMGYVCSKGHHLQRPSTERQEAMDIVLDNIKCSNTSTEFKDCEFVTGHNCVHSEDIFLTCKHTIEECEAKEIYTFYLVDKHLEVTVSGSGLLMANTTGEGKVGTVCDDRFNESSANVICKEMGYKCATAWFNDHSYAGAQENETIVLDNIECGENATRFTDCSYQYHHDCTHNEDVFLICQYACKGKPFAFYLVDSTGHQTTEGEGLLLVHTFKSIEGATSGTVCGDMFNDAAATVICKQMGHDHCISWSKKDLTSIQMMYPPTLNNVTCDNTEVDFTNCNYVFDNECHDDVYLVCMAKTYTEFMCPPGSQYDTGQCHKCGRNTYKSMYDASPCVRCPDGTVSPDGSAGCVSCRGGRAVTQQDALRCVCPEGQFFNFASTHAQCEVCPANTFAGSNVGSTDWMECKACPVDSDSVPGSTSCSCPAGSIWNAETCNACGDGEVSAKGSTQCITCPDIPVLNDKSACKCEPGSFWNTADGTCMQCPANYFSKDTGALECTKCPPYTTSSPGVAGCSFCAEGQQWDDYQCKDCLDGTYGNKIECITFSDNDPQFAKAVKAAKGSTGNSWLWPVIVAAVLLVLCVGLVLAVIHLRNKLNLGMHRLPYGTDILDEAEFMEMSYAPQMTDLGTADNVQLIPVDD